MIGVIQLFLGLFHFDGLLRFISNAVMTGFVFGSATLIILGQLENISGYHTDEIFRNEFHKLFDWFAHITIFDVPTIVIGGITVVIIMLLKSFKSLKYASYAIALILMTILANILNQPSVALVGDNVSIVSGLPAVMLPDFSVWTSLLVPAFAIAFIGLIDAAGVQSVFGDKESRKNGCAQDFIGQGLANIAGSFFSSLPAGGSFSRTALNVNSGAKTRFASIFAGIVTLCIVFFFASAIEFIPHAVLGGLLVVIGANILFRLRHDVMMVFYTSISAGLAMSITFVATMSIPLYYAIFVGIIISFILYIINRSKKSRLMQMERVGYMKYKVKPAPKKFKSNSITILSLLNVNFFFAVANEMINSMFPSDEGVTGAIIILQLRGHNSLNSTILKMFEDYALELREDGNTLILAGVEKTVLEQLDRTNVDEIIGKENIFPVTEIIIESIEQAWAEASSRIINKNS
jgi:SulP family sulfate permease